MTKNAHFVLLLIFAVSRLAFSQPPINLDEYKVLDQSRFIVTYEAMMPKDSLKPTEHKFDRLVLMVGDSISTCYSNTMHRFDSAYTIRCAHKGRDSYPAQFHEKMQGYGRVQEIYGDSPHDLCLIGGPERCCGALFRLCKAVEFDAVSACNRHLFCGSDLVYDADQER